MSNALVKSSVDSLVKSPAVAERFKEVLGKKAPQFLSSLISVSRSMADTEPKSILASAMQAATLDLPIEKSLGLAWIVPYKAKGEKVAQFQIGYRGYIQLAIRTGQYSRMGAKEVYEGEFVGYDALSGELTLVPNYQPKDNEPVVGYAASFIMVNGFRRDLYRTKEDVQKHAQRYSQAYRAAMQYKSGPWFENFDKMALKTVIKDLISHWGIMSVELQSALRADGTVTKDIGAEPTFAEEAVDGKFEVVTNPPEPETPAATPAPEPAPAPAPEPKPAKAAPKKVASKLETLRAKMAESGIDEPRVMEFVRSQGWADESLSSLEDLEQMQPASIQMLIGGWDSVVQEVKQ